MPSARGLRRPGRRQCKCRARGAAPSRRLPPPFPAGAATPGSPGSACAQGQGLRRRSRCKRKPSPGACGAGSVPGAPDGGRRGRRRTRCCSAREHSCRTAGTGPPGGAPPGGAAWRGEGLRGASRGRQGNGWAGAAGGQFRNRGKVRGCGGEGGSCGNPSAKPRADARCTFRSISRDRSRGPCRSAGKGCRPRGAGGYGASASGARARSVNGLRRRRGRTWGMSSV